MPEYFTLAELRALPDVSNATKYPDARVEAAAAYIVATIERVCDTSFVARTITSELHDGGTDAILLDQPHVLSVTTVTENGTAVTGDTFRLKYNVLRRFRANTQTPVTFAAGVGNVAVTYQAGYSTTPPGDIKDAALQGTRARLIELNGNHIIDDRRTSVSNDQGNTTYTQSPDRPTGYRDVDATILRWADKVRPLGFA